MIRHPALRALALRALAGLAAAAALPLPALAGDDEDQRIPFQVVVLLRPGASVNAINQTYQSTTLESIPGQRWFLLRTPAGLDEQAFADALATDQRVERVELHFTGRDTNPDPGTQSIFFGSTRAKYVSQPAWAQINLPVANVGRGGADVLVAVIDSGVDPAHPDLAGRLALPGRNFIDANADVRDIGDGQDSDGDGLIDEAVGHGTLVTGVIARLAPSARVLPLKVLDSDGFTTVFRVASAVYWAADAGARVINVSLGTTADQAVLEAAVAYASQRGALVVASLGNEDQREPVRFPSGHSFLPGVVGVAGVGAGGVRAPFSNYGPHASISAPAVRITSTVPNGLFGEANGTSFGAPMVSAAAAILLSNRPTFSPAGAGQWLRLTAAPIDAVNPGYQGWLGAGQLDLRAALGPAATRRVVNPDAR